jgi:hypothetical protein
VDNSPGLKLVCAELAFEGLRSVVLLEVRVQVVHAREALRFTAGKVTGEVDSLKNINFVFVVVTRQNYNVQRK